MEVAVSKLIGWRENVIIPNVSWGFDLQHECDLLVMNSSRRLTEIEIKVSAQDLKRDFQKPHGHSSPKISRLVYAVPEKVLALAREIVPPQNGIIVVRFCDRKSRYEADWIRRCRHRGQPITEGEALRLLRLGCIRIWPMKERLHPISFPKPEGQPE